MTIKIM